MTQLDKINAQLPLVFRSCISNFGSMLEITLANDEHVEFRVFITASAEWRFSQQGRALVDSDHDKISETVSRILAGRMLQKVLVHSTSMELQFEGAVIMRIWPYSDDPDYPDDIVDFFGFDSRDFGFSIQHGFRMEDH